MSTTTFEHTQDAAVADKGYAHPDVLVSTAWLAEHLNDPGLRILESDEDILLYELGHIPGAQKIDWLADLNDSVVRDYVNRDTFQEVIRRLGIDETTTVILYGDKNNWWATYAYWVFQLFGLTNVKIVDGGRTKWEQEGRPYTIDTPKFARSNYTAPERDDSSIRAFKPQVQEHFAAKRPLIDVRSPDEFSGKKTHMPEYPQEGVLRGGHIPGARSVPWARAAKSGWLVQERRRPARNLRAGTGTPSRRRRDRLLPHRRTLEPHVVCADLPARLREGAQLRRLVDRMG